MADTVTLTKALPRRSWQLSDREHDTERIHLPMQAQRTHMGPPGDELRVANNWQGWLVLNTVLLTLIGANWLGNWFLILIWVGAFVVANTLPPVRRRVAEHCRALVAVSTVVLCLISLNWLATFIVTVILR